MYRNEQGRDPEKAPIWSRQDDHRVRGLRPPKPAIDPWQPLDVLEEPERWPGGIGDEVKIAPTLAVFLAGAECPFTCVFCDLWRFTLNRPTPPGALPAQVRRAVDGWYRPDRPLDPRARIKLYNASNFFDRRAVPPEDLPELARLVEPFPHVTVENHPRLTDRRCRDFQCSLTGRLEVALGLESVHPRALPRLHKRIKVEDFDRAAERLLSWDIDLRTFALVGTPYVPWEEGLEWTVATVEHALARGARRVALNPVRGGDGELGNGELERLAAVGDFTPPRLADLEDALDACLALPAAREAVVVADLWDAERFARCPACAPARLARLQRINLSGVPEPRVPCLDCGEEGDEGA